MAGSLLAYLYPRIRGSQEDVATLSLSYLLTQSDILCSAFTKALSMHLHLSPDMEKMMVGASLLVLIHRQHTGNQWILLQDKTYMCFGAIN